MLWREFWAVGLKRARARCRPVPWASPQWPPAALSPETQSSLRPVPSHCLKSEHLLVRPLERPITHNPAPSGRPWGRGGQPQQPSVPTQLTGPSWAVASDTRSWQMGSCRLCSNQRPMRQSSVRCRGRDGAIPGPDPPSHPSAHKAPRELPGPSQPPLHVCLTAGAANPPANQPWRGSWNRAGRSPRPVSGPQKPWGRLWPGQAGGQDGACPGPRPGPLRPRQQPAPRAAAALSRTDRPSAKM